VQTLINKLSSTLVQFHVNYLHSCVAVMMRHEGLCMRGVGSVGTIVVAGAFIFANSRNRKPIKFS
jgi:hypothetical protein